MGAEWRPVKRTPPLEQLEPSWSEPAREPQSVPRWHTPTSESPGSDKLFASADDVRRLIASLLGGKLAGDFRLFLGDNQYYLPPMADAQEIIGNSGLARATYMPESFDCDDFAMVLKAHFCEAAYKDFQRRPPHCVGLIWGELPHVHAVNWMINNDGRLRLIEPQTGEVFEPRGDTRNITFMMA